ncbi:sigma-70 family RNA polymerase sigma factor [Fictibacillus sp. Mic-4]|uniref:sigma-70 family RNA polymerase sigma factor n=1 Tax=Fictibacillus sp. Mic-4 TaxID=3132826 RepID=UPI003CEBCEA7
MRGKRMAMPAGKEKWIYYQSREEILHQLMDMYEQSVIRLAYTYVRDRRAAEDIAQEVFVRCYMHIDGFRHEASLKTWVFTITANLCKDYLRSGWKKYINVVDLMVKLKKSDPSTPELKVVQKSEQEELINGVFTLPIKYREVIILHYYQDLSIKEMAEVLQKKEATIRTRLQRAREMLKGKLQQKGVKGWSDN